MTASDQILIVGASSRAAAFSALRAGLRPNCIDLFADADLSLRVPVQRIALADYPRGLPPLISSVPAMPWLYTGALENHVALISRIAQGRLLWGNDSLTLASARSPRILQTTFDEAGMRSPRVYMAGDALPAEGNWLLKPLRNPGGGGIKPWIPGSSLPDSHYLQQVIEGNPCSAVYVGDGRSARLLGVTGQLTGAAWLHAAEFQYCGSIGPMALTETTRTMFEKIGDALVDRCRLQGLFGVDAILKDSVPWPVEVNPRYTASVEVLEHTLGISALALHRACFEPGATVPRGKQGPGWLGKAILFACAPLRFPEHGPWLKSLDADIEGWQMPEHADIPAAGELIEKEQPILTMLASGRTLEEALGKLKRQANALDHLLFEG
jgi:predicted ATP-grasp superfamily ATP-dependent carboligase